MHDCAVSRKLISETKDIVMVSEISNIKKGAAGQSPALSLQARTSDDIKILSALLQDALIASADMVFEKRDGTFMLVANRFCWELENEPHQMRCMCGIKFGYVRHVRMRGLAPQKTQFYNLLSIEYQEAEEHVVLVFSGGGGIQLEISCLMVVVQDLVAPHPSFARPDHS